MTDRSSPTLTLVLFVVATFVFQVLLNLVGIPDRALALTWPIGLRPWALVSATFAHANLQHLIGNLIPMVIAGLLIERRASYDRFYLFFLLVGALSSVSQVFFGAVLFGVRPAVLGASGAVFGLIGYLLTGNRLSDRVIAGFSLSPRAQIGGFLALAAVVAVATYGPGVALISHFTGFFLGLLAGRGNLLRASGSSPTADPGQRV